MVGWVPGASVGGVQRAGLAPLLGRTYSGGDSRLHGLMGLGGASYAHLWSLFGLPSTSAFFSANDFTSAYGGSSKEGSFTPYVHRAFKDSIKTCILDGEMVGWNPEGKCIGKYFYILCCSSAPNTSLFQQPKVSNST